MELHYQRVVIKLGTSTLTAGTEHLSTSHMVDLVRQMAFLHNQGCDLILVSSGAIAVGRQRLNFPRLPKDIPGKQMLAAVGQPRLMALYEQMFGFYGLMIAQVLLTRIDLSIRTSYLNSRNTLQALLAKRVIPIVNENDTVGTEEIRVGDNDNLSAMVATLSEADLLMLLTDQEGLLTSDPSHDSDTQLIREISGLDIPEEIWQAARGPTNNLGTGGMESKLQAADLARRSGAKVVIARGGEQDILLQIAAGKAVGTQFHPIITALEGRKRYILAQGHSVSALMVDEGAADALRRGGSLLPVGVLKIEGNFERGDTVGILDLKGREIARGLVNYTSADLGKICGKQSDLIEDILGFFYSEEVIHRNNMVLL
jgi:glutamate 5-kinase